MESGKRTGVTAALVALLFVVLAPTDARAATDCLACHGEKDFKGAAGHSLFVDGAKQKASAHGSLTCKECHKGIEDYPHAKKMAKVQCGTCHEDQAKDIPQSVHAALGATACANCHGEPHAVQTAAQVMPQQCAACHAEEVHQYGQSIHASAREEGDKQGAICSSCHGPVHRILAADDPKSTVAKKNLPDTCGGCHSNPDFLSKHQIPFAHPVEAYKLSVHGRAVAAGNTAAAACSDCHGSHAIFPGQDARSMINRWNVPKTCGACHSEIEKIYTQSIHGQAVGRGAPDAPVCTDCHGEHLILAPQNAESLVSPGRVSTVTCGRCHGDASLDARYNLPADRVPTFADSYHGLESRAGGQRVANCASCHGIHNIFPSSDPRSTIFVANLAHTCGKCHAGAGKTFGIGPVHIRAKSASEPLVVRWIRLFYWSTIPLAVGFMFLHHLLDFLKKMRRKGPRTDSGEEIERMNLHFRIAHGLVVVSFPVLVLTGFALKFPETWWAQPLLVWEDKFAFRGLVHRVAAVVLLASLGYHLLHLIFIRHDRAFLRAMIPDLGDARTLSQLVLYNLGLGEKRPTFGKFNYIEKVEYFAFVWGSAVMAATGFTLWFNNLALRYFPKWFSDAATALHYYEAILATLAILIWHFYTVIFDPDVYPMDRAWLTGMASADHLRHTRPEYYAELRRAQERGERERREEEEKGKKFGQGP